MSQLNTGIEKLVRLCASDKRVLEALEEATKAYSASEFDRTFGVTDHAALLNATASANSVKHFYNLIAKKALPSREAGE